MNTPATATVSEKPRVLTGDTPTGSLHIGHYVGSLENRIAMQDDYDCYFIIANVHALTTRPHEVDGIRADTISIVKDWLAVGMDPKKSTFFLQSEIPAIAELTWYFAMLLGYNRLLRNPTINHEINVKGLGDQYSFGFLMYAVGQMADILAFRPQYVPVGEDQLPHIEMTREIAARFNLLYCSDPASQKGNMEKRLKRALSEGVEGVFPLPEAKVGRVARLTGTDGVNKMSKSLNNAIFLTDDEKTVQKKCNKIFTGRGSLDDPPVLENNVVLEYLRTFSPDQDHVNQLIEQYASGQLGDGHLKKEAAEVINAFLTPIRTRHAEITDTDVMDVLKAGNTKANTLTEQTLYKAKQAMRFDFGERALRLGVYK